MAWIRDQIVNNPYLIGVINTITWVPPMATFTPLACRTTFTLHALTPVTSLSEQRKRHTSFRHGWTRFRYQTVELTLVSWCDTSLGVLACTILVVITVCTPGTRDTSPLLDRSATHQIFGTLFSSEFFAVTILALVTFGLSVVHLILRWQGAEWGGKDANKK